MRKLFTVCLLLLLAPCVPLVITEANFDEMAGSGDAPDTGTPTVGFGDMTSSGDTPDTGTPTVGFNDTTSSGDTPDTGTPTVGFNDTTSSEDDSDTGKGFWCRFLCLCKLGF